MKKYYRTRKDNFAGGVLGGLGVFLNFDPLLLRIAFTYALFLGGEPIARIIIPAYLALWFFAPAEPAPVNEYIDAEEVEEGILRDEETEKP
jgi:phage shock protein PspC (stress-responsive transcriptional regulator)